MATERIDIRITEDGARVVTRNIDQIGQTAEKSAGSLDFLKKALSGLAAYLSFSAVKNLTSQWIDLNSRVRIATTSQANAAAVMERLQIIARRTYADLNNIGEVYLSNAQALDELGYSTQEQLDFTEAMTNALVVSGAKQQRAETVINALSKAMMNGTLQGMNWTTVLQQGGRIVQALAEGTGKSIRELDQMARAGSLDTDTVFAALTSQLKILQEEADSMPATINDAMTRAKTPIMATLAEIDERLGFTEKVVAVIDFLSNNLMALGKALIGVSSGLLLVGGGAAAINKVTASVLLLNKAIRANPIGIFLTLLVTVVGTLAMFRNDINISIDDVTTLGDVASAVGLEMVKAWVWVRETYFAVFGGMINFIQGVLNSISGITSDSVGGWMSTFDEFYADTGQGVAGILRAFAKTFDAIDGLLVGVVIGMVTAFKGVPDALREVFNRSYNWVVGLIEDMVNVTLKGVNKLRAAIRKEPLELVAFQRKEVNDKYFEEFGQRLAGSIDAGFEAQGGAAQKWLSSVLKTAQDIGKARRQGDAEMADLLARRERAEALSNAELKELNETAKSLDAVIAAADPVIGAQRELAEGLDVLTKAARYKLITDEEQVRLSGLLRDKYRDALDPMGAYNRKLEEERTLLKLGEDERKIEAKLLADVTSLKEKGVIVDQARIALMREELVALQDLNDAAAIRDNLLKNSSGRQQQDFMSEVSGIAELLASQEDYTATDTTSALSGLMGPEMFAGTQEMLDLQVSMHEQAYERIAEMQRLNMINENTANQMRAKADIELLELKIANQRQFYNDLSVLSQSGNRKVAMIGRAAALYEAGLAAKVAVMKAYASAPPPMNYALAAAAGIAQAANMAQIAGLAFQTGGQFKVGGSGGPDSQMVSFRATPGERVSVATPQQVRKGDPYASSDGGGNSEGSGSSIRVINVLDKNLMQDYLTSSSGERILLNVIQRNASAIKSTLG